MEKNSNSTNLPGSEAKQLKNGSKSEPSENAADAPNSRHLCKTKRLNKTVHLLLLPIEKPHLGAQLSHTMVNPKLKELSTYSNMKPQTIVLITEKTTEEICRTIIRIKIIMTPITIVLDSAIMGFAIYKDVKNGTARNSVEAAVGIAGGFGGAYVGAAGGAFLGSLISPGIGTIVGGLIGSLVASFGVSIGAEKAVEAISDNMGWEIIIKHCKSCGQEFRVHVYKGEKYIDYCELCQ